MKTLIRNLAVAAPLAFATLTMAPVPAFATDPIIVLPPSEPEPAPFDIAIPDPEPVDPQGPDQIAQPKPGPVQPEGPDEIAQPKPGPVQPDGPDTLADPEPGPVVDPAPEPVDPPVDTVTEPSDEPTTEPSGAPESEQPGTTGQAEGPAYEPVVTPETTDVLDVDEATGQDATVWFVLAALFAALAALVVTGWQLARRRA